VDVARTDAVDASEAFDRTATVLERGRADNEAWAAFRINHPHGLHGRPSAHVFKALRRAAGDLDALLDLECGGRTVNVRATEVAPTTFWRLKARRGERVQVRAQGPDAQKVVALVMQELKASTGTHEEAFTPEVDAALLEEFGSWEAVQAWAFSGGPGTPRSKKGA